jgi:hypothetical protein
MNKLWYTSKTLWVNLIAIVAIVIWGKELDAATIGIILSVINMILRILTKAPVVWTNGQ